MKTSIATSLCLIILGSATASFADGVVAPGAKLEKLSGDFAFTEGPASDAAGNSAFLNRLLMILVTQMYDCAVVRPTAFTLATGMEATKTSW